MIEELFHFHVSKIDQLAELIPNDITDKMREKPAVHPFHPTHIIRIALIVKHRDDFFEFSKLRSMDTHLADILAQYGVDRKYLASKINISTHTLNTT